MHQRYTDKIILALLILFILEFIYQWSQPYSAERISFLTTVSFFISLIVTLIGCTQLGWFKLKTQKAACILSFICSISAVEVVNPSLLNFLFDVPTLIRAIFIFPLLLLPLISWLIIPILLYFSEGHGLKNYNWIIWVLCMAFTHDYLVHAAAF
jgi:hypothetical protein